MTQAEALHSIYSTHFTPQAQQNREPAAEIECLKQAGFLTIVLPGEALDFNQPNRTPQLLSLLKDVGRASLPVGRIYEGHINALFLIHRFATPAQQQAWYADAADGCLFGVWNTQAHNGVSMVEKSTGGYELQGMKTFASGVGLVDRALITGELRKEESEGWQMCIANMHALSPQRIDKYSWQPLGMESSISYTADVSGMAIDGAGLLGAPGDYYRQPYFSGGAIRFAAVQLGGAEALFNSAVAFLKSLHRTDDPFQSVRLADMTIALSSGSLWLQQAAQHFDEWHADGAQSSRLIAFANMTRTAIERICWQVIELSAKCVGARGLMQPYALQQQTRDLQFYLRQPAPDAALADVAKYMIQSHKDIQNLWA